MTAPTAAIPPGNGETAGAADCLASRYAFSLPPELVAQQPAGRRDASRLMHLLPDGTAEDRIFSELPELLVPGDLLVRNDVRVFPARLRGRRRSGGAAEVLLAHRDDSAEREIWLCLARPANRFKPGREFDFGGGLIGRALGVDDRGMARLEFPFVGSAFMEILERVGQVPLPPYIARPGGIPTPEDAVRYQTIYAARPGAVAAPTAGLHFTPEVDARLRERGVRIAGLTLHVGPGTFRPIKAAKLDEHRMDPEWFEIPPQTWREALRTRERGGRVVAVGTTTVRALETAAGGGGKLSGWTDIFIRPGHRFALVDGLVTNFHLPASTLIVLAAALVGRRRILSAYAEAVAKRYRFYSYGDAMLAWHTGERSAMSTSSMWTSRGAPPDHPIPASGEAHSPSASGVDSGANGLRHPQNESFRTTRSEGR